MACVEAAMSVARVHPMSLTEFLAWEERQEFKYEFDGFVPVAMVGVTVAHSAIQRNVLFALTGRLRGKPCQPHGSELKVQVVGRIRYPDAFVTCTPRANNETIVTDPVVIFEIISNESDRRNRITKNEEYRLTPSIQRYVMLEPDEPAAMVFAREGERWVGTLHKGDAILAMPEIGIEIPLAEFYEGLDFTLSEPAV
jgi:Uma2 family endonuclease